MKIKRTGIDIGGIFAVFLYLLSVYWDIWSKIDSLQQFLLAIAIIMVYLNPLSFKETKEETQ